MNIVKRISSVGLASGAGLLLGGCLTQDPASAEGYVEVISVIRITGGLDAI
ncbi:MAG: hypothetical protein JF616_20960 [Fibrobacteres bacterium]|nr:hypothetical protein [Fibrobacterota bacterium]